MIGRNLLLLVCLLALLPSSVHSANPEEVVAEMPNRQRQVLEEAALNESLPPFHRGAAACFLGEPLDDDQWIVTPGQSGYPLCDTLLRLRLLLTPKANQHLSEAHREQLRDQIGSAAQSIAPEDIAPASPESHSLLANTIQLLHEIADESVAADRAPSGDALVQYSTETVERLSNWLGLRARFDLRGPGADDHLNTICGLLALADLSPNARLADQARALLDRILADAAIRSIGGSRLSLQKVSAAWHLSAFFPVYFGIHPPMEEAYPPDVRSIHMAASGYQPPKVVVRLGCEWNDRGSYEVNRQFRLAGDERPPDAGQPHYSYITSSYALSSLPLRNQTVPRHMRPWELRLHDGRASYHRVFALAGNQLFSGEQQTANDDRYMWNATVMQHENVLCARFHRSDRRPNHFPEDWPPLRRYVQQPTRIWFPDSLQPVMQEGGWWFTEFENVYIALRPLKGSAYWWRSVSTDVPEAHEASLLTLQDLQSGFLLEVETATRFITFERFRQQVRQAPLVVERNSVTFVSRAGDVILFPLEGGDFLVNGRPVGYDQQSPAPLHDSRFLFSEWGSGRFRAFWEPDQLEVNFTQEGEVIRQETLQD
mgnify:CR=1 FL=1